MSHSDVLCAIPARYKSSRFPGKPLAPIAGTPMVIRVAEAAKAATDWVVVATEDERVAKVCREHGVEAVLTGDSHPTGTDRVAEVAARLQAPYVVNIQGDEPLLPSAHIRSFVAAARAAPTPVVNAMSLLPPAADPADVTIPKVVVAPGNRLVYISRSVVPNSVKGTPATLYRQVGVYGFTAEALKAYASLGGRGSIERHEDIEILRFLDLDVPITMVEMADYGPAVDLPEHVALVESHLRRRA